MDYIFENPETGDRFTISGAEALDIGVVLSQPARSGSVWFYEGASYIHDHGIKGLTEYIRANTSCYI